MTALQSYRGSLLLAGVLGLFTAAAPALAQAPAPPPGFSPPRQGQSGGGEQAEHQSTSARDAPWWVQPDGRATRPRP
jgi:hypothetical protein